ncbi:O-antigen ligase family protein [Microbacterium thalli]|uniref:O-antigen ligase family protein n=1 Tax=Microbacterium thalli TaxID=3027921 RepID=A0ABT5SKZ7_9MICO|nr:O-antigen ligase family protein [Microbacterium thalli]MDD7963509.1 O-antigen ligase family protein [Microbacterium thalli]
MHSDTLMRSSSVPLRRAALWTATVAITTASVLVAIQFPPAGLALVLASGVVAIVRSIPGLAILLLLAGPILGPRIQLGAVTLDNVLTLVGLALAFLWAITQRRLPFTALSAFSLALSFSIGVSALASGTPSGPAILRYIGVAALAGIVVLSRDSISPARVRRIGLGVTLTAALTVIAQPFITLIPAYQDPDTGVLRYGGLVGHPNFAACVLAITILYLVASGPANASSWICIGVMGTAILTTGSLGALGALGIAALILVLKSFRWLVSGLVAAGIVFAIAGGTLLARVDGLANLASGQNSLTWRFERWSQSLGLAPVPNFFGIGWEQIESALNGPAHSSYVAIYVELGLIGVAALTAGAVITARAAHKERFSLAVIIFVLIASATDPVIFYPATVVTWVLVLGLRQREGDGPRKASASLEEQDPSPLLR